MGKLKEVFSEIMEDFDWERFIIGLCWSLAFVSFGTGLAMALAFQSFAYLLLWLVSIVAAAFATGVEG